MPNATTPASRDLQAQRAACQCKTVRRESDASDAIAHVKQAEACGKRGLGAVMRSSAASRGMPSTRPHLIVGGGQTSLGREVDNQHRLHAGQARRDTHVACVPPRRVVHTHTRKRLPRWLEPAALTVPAAPRPAAWQHAAGRWAEAGHRSAQALNPPRRLPVNAPRVSESTLPRRIIIVVPSHGTLRPHNSPPTPANAHLAGQRRHRHALLVDVQRRQVVEGGRGRHRLGLAAEEPHEGADLHAVAQPSGLGGGGAPRGREGCPLHFVVGSSVLCREVPWRPVTSLTSCSSRPCCESGAEQQRRGRYRMAAVWRHVTEAEADRAVAADRGFFPTVTQKSCK